MAPVDAISAAGAVLATGAAAGAAVAAWGGLSYTSQIFGPSLVAPPAPDQLALTFDDGPNPAQTPRLLEILSRHGARATFFLIGDYVVREPSLTREIAAAGHAIGNHTMHHAWLPRHTSAFIRHEIAGCNDAIEDVLGARVRLFRPPHGARRPAVMRIARELGLETVQWNLMVGDWKNRSEDDLLTRMERGMARNRHRGQGTNLVLHDGGQAVPAADRTATVTAVQMLLRRLPLTVQMVQPPRWT